MAFVPGFAHDVFISYSHADDPAWIDKFVDRLASQLPRLLPGATVWLDKNDLRKSRDFNLEIPAELSASATLISLVSPSYIRSPYCVDKECRAFLELAAARRQTHFATPAFSTERFGFRCPIFQLDDPAYWNDLIPGATDILFGDDASSFPIPSDKFETKFLSLIRGLKELLIRMRNHGTPIVVYPRTPSSEIKDTHAALTRELHAQSYRVLPEDELDPIRHINAAGLAVLLLDSQFNEVNRRLVDEIKKLQKPFLVWPSPSLQTKGDLTQRGFLKNLTDLEHPHKNLLSPFVTPEKLIDEIIAIIRPEAKIPPAPDRKPVVYLVFDPAQNSEADNAGQIIYHYRQEFHFEASTNPRLHTAYLIQSDGVLLVWGNAAENWCASEFDQMVRLSNRPKSRGLCLFDPQLAKLALAQQIRSQHSDICVAEQFGAFDRTRLEPFFNPLRQAQAAAPGATP